LVQTAHRYGSFFAPNNIGVIYRDRKDFNRALAWFRRAVKNKDANANLNIAKIYLKHKKDNDNAIYYLNELLMADSEDCTESAKEEARLLLDRVGSRRKPQEARARPNRSGRP
jgi:TPR repeat protein